MRCKHLGLLRLFVCDAHATVHADVTFRYDVKLDFKEHIGVATIKLQWKHLQDTSDAFAVIPSGRLVYRLARVASRVYVITIPDMLSALRSENHIGGSPFSVPFQTV
jgi:hypothetical protein